MSKYNSVSVKFEHSTEGSDNRRDSEFAVLAELKRQYPAYEDITILECEFR
jgi:hypothetical protein